MSIVPPQVKLLAPRERQIAEIIYLEGSSTAKDVQSKLYPLSNSAVRSMLTRLVRKGILDQQSTSRGPGHRFFYTPAITSEGLRTAVLEQVVEQYFRGSLLDAAKVIISLIEQQGNDRPSLRSSHVRAAHTTKSRPPIKLRA